VSGTSSQLRIYQNILLLYYEFTAPLLPRCSHLWILKQVVKNSSSQRNKIKRDGDAEGSCDGGLGENNEIVLVHPFDRLSAHNDVRSPVKSGQVPRQSDDYIKRQIQRNASSNELFVFTWTTKYFLDVDFVKFEEIFEGWEETDLAIEGEEGDPKGAEKVWIKAE